MKKLALVTTLAIMASGSSAMAMDNKMPVVTNNVTTDSMTNVTTSTTTTNTTDMKKVSKVIASELRPSAGDPGYTGQNGVPATTDVIGNDANTVTAQSNTATRSSGTVVVVPEENTAPESMRVEPTDPVAVDTQTESLTNAPVKEAEIARDGEIVPGVRPGEMVEDVTPEEVLDPNQPMEKTTYDIPGATRTVEPLGEIAVDGK